MGFESLYHKRSAKEMGLRVAILESHVLNSILPAMGTLEPHHMVSCILYSRTIVVDKNASISTQVLHLAAEGDAYRREVFQSAAKTLCRSVLSAVNNNSDDPTISNNEQLPIHLDALPPQLGLTRKYLQQAAVTMYVRTYVLDYLNDIIYTLIFTVLYSTAILRNIESWKRLFSITAVQSTARISLSTDCLLASIVTPLFTNAVERSRTRR